MPEKLSPYQKSTKHYFQLMATILLVLSTFFIFKIKSGGDKLNTLFSWLLLIIIILCIVTIIIAHWWASKFGKKHYDEDMKMWDFRTLPAGLFLIIAFISAYTLEGKIAAHLPFFLIFLSIFYVGFVAYKTRVMYGYVSILYIPIPLLNVRGDTARRYGIILMLFGILSYILLQIEIYFLFNT
ncbi:hypothetical protein JXB31_01940 [Candidatus Woesearchaeota archaeon]|nr:hypothetical protein [Candidatus Woesearchaeota archaeon]